MLLTDAQAIMVGGEVVEAVYLGAVVIWVPGGAPGTCADSEASVRMTGWMGGERILAPIGYAPYGRETYTYGDEVVRHDGSAWIFENSGYGEIVRVYDMAMRPWLAVWPSPYSGAKYCGPEGSGSGSGSGGSGSGGSGSGGGSWGY